MRTISPTFLREYRKQFLVPETGEVLPGMQSKVDMLLELMRLLQEGRIKDVIEIGYYNGLDLEAMYRDYCKENENIRRTTRKTWALQVRTRRGWSDAVVSHHAPISRTKLRKFQKRGIDARIVYERRPLSK
jgi:hypothetical protein